MRHRFAAPFSLVAVAFFLALALSSYAETRRAEATRAEIETATTARLLSQLGWSPQPDACSYKGSIACSATKTGNATSCTDGDYYVDFWTFTPTSKTVVTLLGTTSLTTYNLVVGIQLQSTGEFVAVNYDTDGSVTTTATLNAGVEYAISVGFLHKFYSGAYTLKMTCGPVSTPTCTNSGTLSRDFTYNLGMTDADKACGDAYNTHRKYFSFEAAAGVPVRIIANSATLPIYLEVWSLNDPSGAWKYQDPQSTYLVYYPARSGQQTLMIAPDDSVSSTKTGAFTLRIEEEPLEACKRRAIRH